MKINIHNYEQYLVDYADGKLSAPMNKMVAAFLLANPIVQEELNQFMKLSISTYAKNKIDKTILKKIPANNTTYDSPYFEQLCIGKVEQTNTSAENELLATLVMNDLNKRRTLSQFEKTKLKPERIYFNEKLLLKRDALNPVINNENFEEYSVASREGWLDSETEKALSSYFHSNAAQEQTFNLLQSISLKPDYSIIYPNKNQLKKVHLFSDKTKKRLAYLSGIAAAIAISFLAYNVYEIENKQQWSRQIEPTIKVEEKPTLALTQENNITYSEKKQIIENIKFIEQGIIQDYPIEARAEKKLHAKNKTLECMLPIRIFEIECPKCTDYQERTKFFNLNTNHTSIANLGSQTSIAKPINTNDEIAWKVAQASIYGINKLTNASLALTKTHTKEKTRIGFNSKYFSISGPVRKK